MFCGKTFAYDYEKYILSNLIIDSIPLYKLEGTSNFGAMDDEGDGDCADEIYIENYLKK